MQTNEFVGRAQHGPRRPHAKKTIPATRVTPETRAQAPDADESRRRSVREPMCQPPRYGAGF